MFYGHFVVPCRATSPWPYVWSLLIVMRGPCFFTLCLYSQSAFLLPPFTSLRIGRLRIPRFCGSAWLQFLAWFATCPIVLLAPVPFPALCAVLPSFLGFFFFFTQPCSRFRCPRPFRLRTPFLSWLLLFSMAFVIGLYCPFCCWGCFSYSLSMPSLFPVIAFCAFICVICLPPISCHLSII